MTTRKKTAVAGTKAGAVPKAGAAAKVAVAPASPVELQMKTWEQAVQLFTARRFAEACERLSGGGETARRAHRR